jgi:Na+-driven multidrug efflux pump
MKRFGRFLTILFGDLFYRFLDFLKGLGMLLVALTVVGGFMFVCGYPFYYFGRKISAKWEMSMDDAVALELGIVFLLVVLGLLIYGIVKMIRWLRRLWRKSYERPQAK